MSYPYKPEETTVDDSGQFVWDDVPVIDYDDEHLGLQHRSRTDPYAMASTPTSTTPNGHQQQPSNSSSSSNVYPTQQPPLQMPQPPPLPARPEYQYPPHPSQPQYHHSHHHHHHYPPQQQQQQQFRHVSDSMATAVSAPNPVIPIGSPNLYHSAHSNQRSVSHGALLDQYAVTPSSNHPAQNLIDHHHQQQHYHQYQRPLHHAPAEAIPLSGGSVEPPTMWKNQQSRNTTKLKQTSKHPHPLSPLTTQDDVLTRKFNDRVSSGNSEKHYPVTPSSAAITWNAQDPTEWTLERVLHFLETNRFGEEWQRTFMDRNICGEKFLSLASYQNLKKLGHFYGKSEESSPSRFIHVLRKLLNRSTSTNSAEGVVNSANANTGDPRESYVKEKDLDFIVPPAPAPAPRSSSELGGDDDELNNKTMTASTQDRPASFYDANAKSLWYTPAHQAQAQAQNQAPSSPSIKPSGLFRRHHKSSSSESSMSTFYSNSTANLLHVDTNSSFDDKTVHKVPSYRDIDETKRKGLLNKFRRHRHGSRDDLQRLDSPTSPGGFMSGSSMTYDYSPLEARHRPVRDNSISRFVLVSTNNETFTTVNISDFQSIEDVKNRIGSELNMTTWSDVTLHLTDFAHSQGEALNDAALSQALKIIDVVKLFVNIPEEKVAAKSPGQSSMDSNPVYPSTPQHFLNQETNAASDDDYFSTKSNIQNLHQTLVVPSLNEPPKQLASSTNNSAMSSTSTLQSTKQQQSSQSQSTEQLTTTTSPPPIITTSLAPSAATTTATPHGAAPPAALTPSSGSTAPPPPTTAPPPPPPTTDPPPPPPVTQTAATPPLPPPQSLRPSRSNIDDSFKVIRPQRREINFDDRRASPYDRKMSVERKTSSASTLSRKPSNLVASRPAPPPPPGRQSSIKLNRTVSTSHKGAKKPISINTQNLQVGPPPVSTFSPGQSENLVPKPYVGGGRKQKVARKPVNSGSDSNSPATPNTELANFKPGADQSGGPSSSSSSLSLPATSHTKQRSVTAPVKPPSMDDKFAENEISFAGAPAFEDDDDDSSDDDGLWAKKPPPKATPAEEPAPKSTPSVEDKKPQLSVQTVHYSASPVKSPVKSPGSSSPTQENWAVRPSAEVVYDNLERFFPNTDLDKPIIDDTLSPPASPSSNEPASSSSSTTTTDTAVSSSASSPNATISSSHNSNRGFVPALSPVAEPRESPAAKFNSTANNSSSGTSTVTANTPSTVTTATTTPTSSTANTDSAVTKSSTTTSSSSNNSSSGNLRTRRGRMKSIRIVAREASEARKRFSQQQATAEQAKGGNQSLLRRKSTKLWGQKIVEVTPSQIARGHLSTLRDQTGEYKQFQWVKGELIGKGTFGKVYLALNATTGEMMAVKQVDVPQTASDKTNARQREVIDALHSEVETMKDLDHLNIVQYLGFEALDDVYNLFLEYVPGGSIGKILQMHGRLEESIIKSLTSQVLEGLSYLHSCGILHRDLKADNLLLDMEGVVKISDFGISKKSRDIYANDAEMSMQGTIFWMAPEVIHNVVHNMKQGYSAKIDVWSLGCVVLEMFAGRRPWSTDEAIGAMYKLGTSRQAPPIPEDTVEFVSSTGKDFLDQCFTIDPNDRPTPQQLLKHAFSVVDAGFKFQDTRLWRMINTKQKKYHLK